MPPLSVELSLSFGKGERVDFDWDRLRDYLLGKPGLPGLIRRVETRVEAIGTDAGPVLKSGWFIPTGGGLAQRETDDELAERLPALAVALNEWSGNGIGTSPPGSERFLLKYLRDNRMTDVAYLTGKNGRLTRVWHEVKTLMAPDSPTESAHDRAMELMRFLKGWMGDCDHRFELQPSDGGIEVYRCECGVGYWQEGDERRAVGG